MVILIKKFHDVINSVVIRDGAYSLHTNSVQPAKYRKVDFVGSKQKLKKSSSLYLFTVLCQTMWLFTLTKPLSLGLTLY